MGEHISPRRWQSVVCVSVRQCVFAPRPATLHTLRAQVRKVNVTVTHCILESFMNFLKPFVTIWVCANDSFGRILNIVLVNSSQHFV